MADFRAFLESQLDDFKDAVLKRYQQEIEDIRKETQNIARTFTDRHRVATVETDGKESPEVPVAWDVADRQVMEVAGNKNALERSGEGNVHERPQEVKKATGVVKRYFVKDFWIRKYDLLTLQALVVKPHAPPMKAPTAEFNLNEVIHDRQPCIVDPDSKLSMWWAICSFLLLTADIVMVPLDLAFEVPPNAFFHTMSWISRVFWTCDIPMSFITGLYIDGVKEMRFTRIARSYITSWFIMDSVIVGSDWVLFLTEASTEHTPLGMLRVFRYVRVLRLMRVGKLKRVFTELSNRISSSIPNSVDVLQDGLKITVFLALGVHFLSCVWYWIGRSTDFGWAGMVQRDKIVYNYLTSMHWALTQLHGSNDIHPSSSAERGFACAAVFIALQFYIFLIARATHAMFVIKDSKAAKLLHISHRFTKSRRISAPLTARIHQYLRAQHDEGIGEQVMRESTLLACLPEALQVDVHAELRVPLVTRMRFFWDMQLYNERALRSLCHVAIEDVVVLGEEIVFAPGDACKSVLFPAQGSLRYLAGCGYQAALTSDEQAWADDEVIAERAETVIERGCRVHLSEATLWTTWEYKGRLHAVSDSVLLALSAEKFEGVIHHHIAASLHALKYARHFVRHLNHNREASSSDIIDISLGLQDLDSDVFTGGDDDHFIFISHYKVEAGTEATLMQEDLERMIRNDFNNAASEFRYPVFLDSENLRNLETLTSHVANSRYLLLLLTPGVLTRPWCLVEIVTAMRQGIEVVPVKVSRPGMQFEFPTEQYYRSFQAGETLSKDAVTLLNNEGIELEDVVACIRAVFKRISLTFSPHGSASIRSTELAEILKACEPVGWEVASDKVHHYSPGRSEDRGMEL